MLIKVEDSPSEEGKSLFPLLLMEDESVYCCRTLELELKKDLSNRVFYLNRYPYTDTGRPHLLLKLISRIRGEVRFCPFCGDEVVIKVMSVVRFKHDPGCECRCNSDVRGTLLHDIHCTCECGMCPDCESTVYVCVCD